MSSALVGAVAAGLVAGYGIAVPVGAVGAYLIALTARTSLRTGVGAALGIASADLLYALTAVAGGAALARAIQPAAGALRWAAVLVLLVLAVRGAVVAVRQYQRAGPGGEMAESRAVAAGSGAEMAGSRAAGTGSRAERPPTGPARAYLTFLAITLMNPVTVIYFAALVAGRQATSTPGVLASAGFVLAAFAASASWQLLLAAGGALLGRALAGRRAALITGLVSSAVIGALALHLLVAAA